MINSLNEIPIPIYIALNEIIVKHEGGLDEVTNTEGDHGGVTRAGITYNEAKGFFGWQAEELQRVNDTYTIIMFAIDKMKSLTKLQIFALYFQEYVQRPNFDHLPKEVLEMVLDCAINEGQSRAARFLQATVNSLMPSLNLKIDGQWGVVSQKALEDIFFLQAMGTGAANLTMVAKFTKAFFNQRMDHYVEICKSDTSQIKFLKGWFNRAFSYLP